LRAFKEAHLALFERNTMEKDGPAQSRMRELLQGYSLEVTAKEVNELTEAAPFITPGTAVSVTFLPGEEPESRVVAAAAVKRLGFDPVSHVSARRLHSEEELDTFLAHLSEAGVKRAFVVAGDLPQPQGPYEDALSIIRSGLLAKHGIRRVGISGYPEGHPDIPQDKLWQALKDKIAALKESGQEVDITTQFGFDSEPVLSWLERLRGEGVEARVRLGIAGPASVRTLLRYASRCGVEASAKVISKYGASILNLLSTAGPDRMVEELAASLDPARHGDVTLHFYPFGGVKKTAEWIRNAAE